VATANHLGDDIWVCLDLVSDHEERALRADLVERVEDIARGTVRTVIEVRAAPRLLSPA
jgi:hypothetical protein